MTTLIAVQGNGWALVGADRRSTDELEMPVRMATSKIIENGGYLIAGAGAVRNCNVLQYAWTPPKPVGDLDKFFTKRFIPAMREAFKTSGIDIKADTSAAQHESEFIVAMKGKVYLVSDDYSWERSANGLYCAGSGGILAMAAMMALNWDIDNPKLTKQNMEIALEIAAELDIRSAAPFDILMQKAPK